MKACVFDGKLKLTDVPDPQPAKDEVLIRVLYSSICNTDLEIIKGYMGFNGILGHEFVGEVVTKTSALYGKRVVGGINCSCGHCYLCLTGRETHCTNRSVLGIYNHPGVFAEYITLPERNLNEVPPTLAMESAVFTEPLAAALEIFEQVHVKPSQSVYIFGAGKLGLLIAMVFRLNGCNYKIFSRSELKVDNASAMGLNAGLVQSLAESDKAEVCIDCTGNPAGISLALSHLYPGGKLVLKTTVAEPEKIDLNQVVINEFTIIGSRCGPFVPAVNLLSQELIVPTPLISKVFPFDEIADGFSYAARAETIKVLIDHRK
jgi:threonine dehydrogenase-like Zn-dependent dehydrogenase